MQEKFKYNFTFGGKSGLLSPFFAHFAHLDACSLLWNSALFYTIGNYHLLKYGCTHLAIVAGIGAALGVAAVGYQSLSNQEARLSGSTAMTSSLVVYNAIKNPIWFSRVNPFLLISIIALSSAFEGKRDIGAGLLEAMLHSSLFD